MSSAEISLSFDGLHADNSYDTHYYSFNNGGKPAEEVLEIVHDIVKDVHDERYRQGIIDAAVARDVGGIAAQAIIDHPLSISESYRLKQKKIDFIEWHPNSSQ